MLILYYICFKKVNSIVKFKFDILDSTVFIYIYSVPSRLTAFNMDSLLHFESAINVSFFVKINFNLELAYLTRYQWV